MTMIQVLPDRVLVGGRLFATWDVRTVDPAESYGATHSLRIRPLLAPQDKPDWHATYQQVREAVHLYHF